MRVCSAILAIALHFQLQGLTKGAFAVSSHSQRPGARINRTNSKKLHAADGDPENDPTKVWYAGVANSIQNVLSSNSPLREGKKALVKSLAGDYDEAAVKARLDGLIADSITGVLMLSFVKWPFCIKAKAVLDAKGAKYTVLELDVDPEGKAIRAEMADVVGRTSVPAIWIGGDFIGGCNDGPSEYGGLNTIDESGKLDQMLAAVGAM